MLALSKNGARSIAPHVGPSGAMLRAPVPGAGERKIIFTLALSLFWLAAQAQPNTPRIGYVYPAGGQVGTTIEVKIGGQFLESVTNASVTGDGITVVVTDFHRPMQQGLFNNLRDKLVELRDKRQAARRGNSSTNQWTGADEKEMETIRDRILKNPPNRNVTPAIADVATLRVNIATNAVPGEREIRLATATGLSNPMKFCVGTLPEFSAPPARAPNPDDDRLRRQFNLPPVPAPQTNFATLRLPIMVNGQIMPGEVDRYRFAARRGQSLVVRVAARDLIPYLADAVPGWFQATMSLHDAKGKELAYNDDFRFQPDPVLQFTVPNDGEYTLEIKDSIYRGREDFVYRISLGELPFITSIFPLGGRVGEETLVAVRGWNLPTNRLSLDTKATGIGRLAARDGQHYSNLIPFAVDDLPEVTEKEPNNIPAKALKLAWPVIINGLIGAPGDTDVFQVSGNAGEEIVAEVTARRLNSPLDSMLKVFDAAGRQLAVNDDHDDLASGLNTHHADSYVRVKFPADGDYFIHLTDTQRQGSPDHGYRLRVSAPRPDFALRVVPASLSVRPGNSVPVRVIALRKDGFTNDITVSLKDAPTGFKLSSNRISAGTNEVRLTLSAPFQSTSQPVALTLEGRAKSGGVELVRPAAPADDLMQAFFYRHLVPAQELQVRIATRPAPGRR